MRIFQMLVTAYALSHIYIFICLRRAFGGGFWQVPALLWLTIMALAWVYRWGTTPGPYQAYMDIVIYTWMGFLIFFCLGLICADALAALSRLLALLLPWAPLKKATALLAAPRYVPIVMALALAMFAFCAIQANSPNVREIIITTKKLPPATPPVRIAAVTDVHIVGLIGPVFLERMVSAINELQPDIFLSGGDLVDSNLAGRDQEAAILRNIRAKYGKFAVTGNHETYRGVKMSLDFMKRSGLRVLRGEAVKAGPVTLVGVDDRSLAGAFPEKTDVLASLGKADGKQFTLLLNHQPQWRKDTIGLFDLQFSGHTHGGQIWPGSIITKRRFGVDQGLTPLEQDNKKSLLYVSNGTGYWGPPVRFLAPPEITLFIIKPEE